MFRPKQMSRLAIAALAVLAIGCSKRTGSRTSGMGMGWGDPDPDIGPDTAPPLPTPEVTYLGEIRAAALKRPVRIAVSPLNGDIIVTDSADRAVHVFGAAGNYRFRIDRVGQPLGCAVSTSGQIFVGDAVYKTIRRYDPAGNLLGQLGSGLVMPSELVHDGQNDVIYVADSRANMVRAFDATGTQVHAFGGEGAGSGQLDFPTGLALDAQLGELFVVDQLNKRIQRFSRQGTFLSAFAHGTRSQGLARDSLGRLYVTDAYQWRVAVVDPNGNHLTDFGNPGSTPGRMALPLDAVVDGYNRLLVTSHETGKILVYGIAPYEQPPPPALPAKVVIEPSLLDVGSKGKWVTVKLQVPGHGLGEVDTGSVRLIVSDTTLAPKQIKGIEDDDGDGVPELILKFEQADVIAALPADRAVRVTVSGTLIGGVKFEGFATLTLSVTSPVNAAGGSSKAAMQSAGGWR